MAYFQHQDVNFHYEEMGQGEAIIALHGFSLNTSYWMQTGVAKALAKSYRVIALDMRAHGKTHMEGEQKGYHVDTLVTDIDALANHLHIDKFHLLSHSTGGMVAVRYAIAQSHLGRLLSLIVSNSSSATQFMNQNFLTDGLAMEMLAQSIEHLGWRQIVDGLKFLPNPLFTGISRAENSSELFDKLYQLMRGGDHKNLALFARRFYNDPDPQVKGMTAIDAPTLIIAGELDSMFIQSSKLMASTIPNAKLVMCENAGHMLALESPKWLAKQIGSFLSEHRNNQAA
ncbi:MAG: alpha/beta hydrolase [Bermanella sp.]